MDENHAGIRVRSEIRCRLDRSHLLDAVHIVRADLTKRAQILEWNAVDVGRHTLRARATDAAGNVQPDVPPWNRLGYGNNAIEVQFVDVH